MLLEFQIICWGSNKLDKMLYNRYSFGGTSHKDVFEYLDKQIPQSEIANSIYISFSDNYSDIKKVYGNYRVIQKIGSFGLLRTRILM